MLRPGDVVSFLRLRRCGRYGKGAAALLGREIVQRLQIVRRHADDLRAGLNRPAQFLCSMDLNQRIHSQFVFRDCPQPDERIVIQRGNDQQQPVRAGRRRFVDLIFVEDKILTQNRKWNR